MDGPLENPEAPPRPTPSPKRAIAMAWNNYVFDKAEPENPYTIHDPLEAEITPKLLPFPHTPSIKPSVGA